MAVFQARGNGMRLLSTSWNRNVIFERETDWQAPFRGAAFSEIYGQGIKIQKDAVDGARTSAMNFYEPSGNDGRLSFDVMQSVLTEGISTTSDIPAWTAVETYQGAFTGDLNTDTYAGTVRELSREERSAGTVNNSWNATGSWDLATLLGARSTSSAYHRVVTAGRDELIGSDFGDTMNAGLRNDVLNGYGGDDYLIGGPGDDQVRGGLGDDQLFDSFSINHLNGGEGADRFYVWSTENDGTWTRKKPDLYWDTRVIKSKGKGKIKQYFVDRNVDIIEDFNIDEDLLYISGSSTFRIRPDGVQIWDSSGTNVTGFLEGLTDYQFFHQVRELPW